MTETETAINDSSADLDFRVESDGNANMLFVDGGNDAVGIGCSPAHTFHADAGGNGTGIIGAFEGSNAGENNIWIGAAGSANNSMIIGYNYAGGAGSANNYGYLVNYGDSPSAAVVIADGGNVGIGAVPGSNKLMVSGDFGATSTAGLYITNTGVATANDLTPVAFTTRSSNWGTQHAATIAAGTTDATDGGAYLALSTSTTGQYAPTERMRIDSSGNVGIGTTSNFGKLSVNVSAGAPATSGDMTNGLTVHNTDGGRAIQLGVNESGAYTFINSGYVNSAGNSQPLAIFTGGTERMRIDSSGNVGIGDSDPSEAKLSIDNVTAGDAGLKIVQAQDSQGIYLDMDGNERGIYVEYAGTTNDALQIIDEGLTTGKIAYFYSNTANTSTRDLVRIRNNHADATGTTSLLVEQDSTGLCADFLGSKIRTSGGILFGTDTAAANALDDYEEGTFSPDLYFGGARTGMSSAKAGQYTKVGNVVHCWFSVSLSDKGSSTGNAQLQGLPFTEGGGVTGAPTASVQMSTLAGDLSGVFGQMSGTDLRLKEANFTTGGDTNITDGDFTDSSIVRGYVSYSI